MGLLPVTGHPPREAPSRAAFLAVLLCLVTIAGPAFSQEPLELRGEFTGSGFWREAPCGEDDAFATPITVSISSQDGTVFRGILTAPDEDRASVVLSVTSFASGGIAGTFVVSVASVVTGGEEQRFEGQFAATVAATTLTLSLSGQDVAARTCSVRADFSLTRVVSAVPVLLWPTELTLRKGATVAITVVRGGPVTFSSADTSVATVTSAGLVTSPVDTAGGATTITVANALTGRSASVTVNVIEDVVTGAAGSGDFDGDGQPSSNDALAVLQAIATGVSLSPAQIAAIDLDGDGRVSRDDATCILFLNARLPLPPPCL